VLLTNVTATPLQKQSINMVWEALLGEWMDDDVAGAAIDYEPYLGKYIANFGQFKDARYTVVVQNGHLAIDVPGQMVYELKPPDEEGKWFFAISDQIAVSFEHDEVGNIVAMKQYQHGLVLELPREGVEIPPEIPLDELQKYLGSYYSEKINETVKLVIKNNCLALEIPGQKTYELRAPNEEGKWLFRVIDQIAVSFKESDDGRIVSMMYHEAGKEFEYRRVDKSDARPLPTVEEILSLRETERHKAVLKKLGTFRFFGAVRLAQSGTKGTVTWHVASTDRHRQDLDYGKFGTVQMAVNKEQAWTKFPFGRVDALRGKFHEQEKHRHPAVIFGDWRDFFDAILVLRTEELHDHKVYALKLKSSEAPDYIVYVDAGTGDMLKAETDVISPAFKLPESQRFTRYEDFREVHGLRIPFRIISENESSGRTVMQFEKIDTNLKINDEIFTLSPPEEH